MTQECTWNQILQKIFNLFHSQLKSLKWKLITPTSYFEKKKYIFVNLHNKKNVFLTRHFFKICFLSTYMPDLTNEVSNERKWYFLSVLTKINEINNDEIKKLCPSFFFINFKFFFSMKKNRKKLSVVGIICPSVHKY